MYYFLNVKHYEQKNVDDNNHPHLQFIKSPRNVLCVHLENDYIPNECVQSAYLKALLVLLWGKDEIYMSY